MKPRFAVVTPFLFFILMFLSPAVYAEAQRQLLDRVVAVVNDEPITQSELDIMIRPFYEQYRKEFQGQELFRQVTEARRKLLNQLIEDRLVFQEAKKQNIEVNETDIDEELASFKSQFKTEEEMEQALREQGMTVSSIRERLRKQAMIRQLHDMEVRSKVIVSPTEIENYFKEHPEEFVSQDSVLVRTITIKKSEQARNDGVKDEEAWTKIQDLRDRIVKGEDFSELAKQFSQDMQAPKGGLGDWLNKGDMISEINDVIFSMKTGEVSEIVETSLGYHLFRMEDRKQGQQKDLEQSRNFIRDKLFHQKSAKRFEYWMTELKRGSYISVR